MDLKINKILVITELFGSIVLIYFLFCFLTFDHYKVFYRFVYFFLKLFFV